MLRWLRRWRTVTASLPDVVEELCGILGEPHPPLSGWSGLIGVKGGDGRSLVGRDIARESRRTAVARAFCWPQYVGCRMMGRLLAALFALALSIASAHAAFNEPEAIPPGSITASDLASGSVTASKLATGVAANLGFMPL